MGEQCVVRLVIRLAELCCVVCLERLATEDSNHVEIYESTWTIPEITCFRFVFISLSRTDPVLRVVLDDHVEIKLC